jgi:prevent-host-death family protein
MCAKAKRREPEIIFRKGKPAAVIIDIDDYQEMLARLEDAEDLKMLAQIRQKPLSFKKLEDFLAECKQY